MPGGCVGLGSQQHVALAATAVEKTEKECERLKVAPPMPATASC